uniref:Uncharacterized protein n=1 Tax=Psilocybe cubensis TaxID=181762 RepID=A0A8H8CEU6_PSICU
MASSTDTTPFVTAFLVLQLSGAGIFALVVFSALIFRTAAKRHPIWFSFCISWIVFGVSYALLLVAGQQFRRPAPERALCTVQAASVYAAPFLVMGSTLGLVVHLLLNVLTALSRSPKKKEHLNIMRALVVLPWMIWVAVLVGVLVPKGDLRFSHHCELNYNWSRSNQQSFDLFAVAIGVHLYQNRGICNIFSQAMAMALRILIFTILGCGALGVGLVFAVTSTRGVQFDLALAILPPAAALTFGTQLDLLRGWLFWRKPVPVIPDQMSFTLTTVNSISSQSTQSIRRVSTASRVPPTGFSHEPSMHQVNGPPDLSSFLHF